MTCYICDPKNPAADEEGCRDCEREAFAPLLDLAAEREARREGYDGLTCPCGGAWFDLRIGPGRIGAVTLGKDGRVTGYAGVPTCRECGEAVSA